MIYSGEGGIPVEAIAHFTDVPMYTHKISFS